MQKDLSYDLVLEQGKGILRLAPNWVPRSFCVPGRRLKLHPRDYFALGADRGGIDERWLSSTTPADNGPKTGEFEGLSFVAAEDNGQAPKILLRDLIEQLKGEVIGDRIWKQHGRWPMYSKLFDNKGALPFHIHHRDEQARLVDQLGKPEAYYFPPQLNNYGGDFPYTFFGLEPGVGREEVRRALSNFTAGDNRITDLSKAYRLEVGTGWDIPPGILHAPGSLCTYEPQKASDVFAMYQSVTGDQVVSEELMWKDTPEERRGDFDFLLEIIDWPLNLDPEFRRHRFMEPRPVAPIDEMKAEGYIENWICYKAGDFSAKELSVLPERSVTIRDSAAYGLILLSGFGSMGVWPLETPALIRFGELTYDEFFVTESAAGEGVRIDNLSRSEPLVMLKHFGPENPDLVLS